MKREQIINKMAGHTPMILGHQAFREYSILLPLLEKEDGLHLLFEVRSLNMRRQPGEICFPGGKVDEEDERNRDTAVREATEELGIGEKAISKVYPFDYLLSPFGMKVSTYVGFIDCELGDLKPNPHEVEEVFTVPLDYFLQNEPEIHYINMEVKPDPDFPYELIPGGRDYPWRTRKFPEHFYRYQDRVIWGLTASVLAHFIDLLKD